MSVLGVLAILLAAVGALILRRAVVRPLAEITRVTEQVAEGGAVAVPYGSRRDEIGALSRSISVFQAAMTPQQGAQPLDGRGDERARASPGASVNRGRGLHNFDREQHCRARRDQRSGAGIRQPSCRGRRSRGAPHRRGHVRFGRSLHQRARHRIGDRRACLFGDGNRPPGGAFERHRREGGRRGRTHQRGGAGA